MNLILLMHSKLFFIKKYDLKSNTEMDSKVGDFVGWQIRFDKKVSKKTNFN